MFATLLGAYPAGPDGDDDERVRGIVVELDAAGLEPLTDGQVRPVSPLDAERVVAQWRFAAAATSRAVKQALPGPYTLALRASSAGADASPSALAERLRLTVDALIEAGCPLIEIEEPAAVSIGESGAERQAFVTAHRVMTAGLDGAVHLSLALTGGNVDRAGAATFFDLPYVSYAFDLIAGPDNWRLIANAPGDRGILCGALDPSPSADDRPELLVWAAHYAASTGGRGLVRVGLANASSLVDLDRERARRKVIALAEAARIASAGSIEELAGLLDPRAVDSRTAAYGRVVPRSTRRR